MLMKYTEEQLQEEIKKAKLRGAIQLVREIACIEENNGGEDIADKLGPIFTSSHNDDTPLEQIALAVYEVYEEYVTDIDE
jgi:hypothetical protein